MLPAEHIDLCRVSTSAGRGGARRADAIAAVGVKGPFDEGQVAQARRSI